MIAFGTQQKLNSVVVLVYNTASVFPPPCEFDLGVIHQPALVHRAPASTTYEPLALAVS